MFPLFLITFLPQKLMFTRCFLFAPSSILSASFSFSLFLSPFEVFSPLNSHQQVFLYFNSQFKRVQTSYHLLLVCVQRCEVMKFRVRWKLLNWKRWERERERWERERWEMRKDERRGYNEGWGNYNCQLKIAYTRKIKLISVQKSFLWKEWENWKPRVKRKCVVMRWNEMIKERKMGIFQTLLYNIHRGTLFLSSSYWLKILEYIISCINPITIML